MNSHIQYRKTVPSCEFYRCFLTFYARIGGVSRKSAKAGSQKVAYILDKIMRENKEIEIMSDFP
jgi:hypothetical protein